MRLTFTSSLSLRIVPVCAKSLPVQRYAMCRMSYHGDDYDLKSVGNSSVNFYAITQRNLRLFSSICLAAPLLVAISVDVSVKIRCYTAQNKPYIRAHLLYYDAFVVTELGNNLCSFNLKACRLAPPRDGAANYARPHPKDYESSNVPSAVVCQHSIGCVAAYPHLILPRCTA